MLHNMLAILHSRNGRLQLTLRQKMVRSAFCIDYRKQNAVTVKDACPIPRMDECLDSLGEARVFYTLFVISGY